MQNITSLPYFQCREASALLLKMDELSSSQFDAMSTTHRVASYASLTFIAISACFVTPVLIGYAAFTFTAAPLVATAGLWVVITVATHFTHERIGYYFQMKILSNLNPKDLFLSKQLKIHAGLLEFLNKLNPDVKPEVKEMLVAFSALVYMQASLNELRESMLKKATKGFDNSVKAAQKALEILKNNEDITKQGNPYGICKEHLNVLKFLTTKEAVDVEKAIFNEDFKPLISDKPVRYLPHYIPMIDCTDSDGNNVKGLNSILNLA